MNRKVTVVGGAGNVGATVARGVAEKQLADVVVIDIADQKAAGVALDMLEACPIWGSDARVLGTGDYAESANSDIVVITSGVPRKPGMSRDDLLNVNYKIMQQVTEQVVKHSPNCIIISCRTRSMRWRRRSTSCRSSRASASSAWPACSTARACARSSPRS